MYLKHSTPLAFEESDSEMTVGSKIPSSTSWGTSKLKNDNNSPVLHFEKFSKIAKVHFNRWS